VGSKGPRKTGTYRAVCAGVAVHRQFEEFQPDVSVCTLSLTRKNTAGSANARGAGGHKGNTHPRRCRIRRSGAVFGAEAENCVCLHLVGVKDRPSTQGGLSLYHLPVTGKESRRTPSRN
jgi:hypothetical protein